MLHKRIKAHSKGTSNFVKVISFTNNDEQILELLLFWGESILWKIRFSFDAKFVTTRKAKFEILYQVRWSVISFGCNCLFNSFANSSLNSFSGGGSSIEFVFVQTINDLYDYISTYLAWHLNCNSYVLWTKNYIYVSSGTGQWLSSSPIEWTHDGIFDGF